MGVLEQAARQALSAAAYYGGLVVLMRVAGKRLAGQTTTFDLIVLITLGVVLQQLLAGLRRLGRGARRRRTRA